MFKKRLIQRTKTLGDRLKKVRLESGYSLEEAEQATQISKKYLAAIEQGDYSILPGPVYIESFLKKYAIFLKVSTDFVLDLYQQQDRKVLKKKYQPGVSVPQPSLPREIITPKLVRIVIISIIILSCLTYLSVEVIKIFSPPELEVTHPDEYLTVAKSPVVVAGITEPEALLTINGKEIFLGEKGEFSESVDLQEGLNIITISASKERSKAQIVTRHVLLASSDE